MPGSMKIGIPDPAVRENFLKAVLHRPRLYVTDAVSRQHIGFRHMEPFQALHNDIWLGNNAHGTGAFGFQNPYFGLM